MNWIEIIVCLLLNWKIEKDKVRVALYNRDSGPHRGRLVLGKTYLAGLDNKCFSRTGRMKRGYHNVPPDIEKEFEREKRDLEKIQEMFLLKDDAKAIKKRPSRDDDDIDSGNDRSKKKAKKEKAKTNTKTNGHTNFGQKVGNKNRPVKKKKKKG
ncbi:hypothetical protein RFI_15982, partial [Reticulomyxa filosa]